MIRRVGNLLGSLAAALMVALMLCVAFPLMFVGICLWGAWAAITVAWPSRRSASPGDAP